MNVLTCPTRAALTLDALIDACARFNPSDRDQRLIVRTLVMPMLARRLEWLGLLQCASPCSEATRTMIDQVERALACASARLDKVRRPSADAAHDAKPRRRRRG